MKKPSDLGTRMSGRVLFRLPESSFSSSTWSWWSSCAKFSVSTEKLLELTRRKFRTLLTATVITTFVLLLNSALIMQGGLQINESKTRLMEVRRCGCSKRVPFNPEPPSGLWSSRHDGGPNPRRPVRYTSVNTTCEKGTVVRGPGQKVIAYTYYKPAAEAVGKQGREYLQGIRENLRLIQEFYPGWIMRLYYDVGNKDDDDGDGAFVMSQLCQIACSEPMFDLCEASHNARLGNASILYPLLWRFLPAMDIQVDTFFSRDLDSRINHREVAAVREFLSSDKSVHVMRDHPAHVAYMMGGMWGAKVNETRKQFLKSFKNMFKDGIAYAPRHLGGYDQLCLSSMVWPWAKRLTMTHDSYLCKKYSYTSPFPTQRVEGVGNYVGSVVSLNATLKFVQGSECPIKCRPKNHKDWIYC